MPVVSSSAPNHHTLAHGNPGSAPAVPPSERLKERPWDLAGVEPAPPTPSRCWTQGSHDHPSRLGSHLTPPLPSHSRRAKAREMLIAPQLPARLLSSQGAEKSGNQLLLAHWDSFQRTTKTQHRRGLERCSQKPTALPVCKGHPTAPSQPGAPCVPPAHKGLFVPRGTCPPVTASRCPPGPQARFIQPWALAAPASTCRVPARSRARLSGAVGRHSCSARAGRGGQAAPPCCSPLVCRGVGAGEHERDWRCWMPPWQSDTWLLEPVG